MAKKHLYRNVTSFGTSDLPKMLLILEKVYSNDFGDVLSFTCFYNFINKHKQFVYQTDVPASLCFCEICENVCLMGEALKDYNISKDIQQWYTT